MLSLLCWCCVVTQTFCLDSTRLLESAKQERRRVLKRVDSQLIGQRSGCMTLSRGSDVSVRLIRCSSLNQQEHLQITCLHFDRYQSRSRLVFSLVHSFRLTLEDVYSFSQLRSFTTTDASLAVVAKIKIHQSQLVTLPNHKRSFQHVLGPTLLSLRFPPGPSLRNVGRLQNYAPVNSPCAPDSRMKSLLAWFLCSSVANQSC